jgi:hypothetical protein
MHRTRYLRLRAKAMTATENQLGQLAKYLPSGGLGVGQDTPDVRLADLRRRRKRLGVRRPQRAVR